MRPESQSEAVVQRFYNELWNQWQLGVADEILSATLRFRGSLGTVCEGREDFKAYAESVRAAFPDWHNRIDEILAVGDRVVTRMTWTGTHRGPLGDVEPTGAQVEYPGAAFFRLAHGLIEEAWVVGDTQDLWRQMLEDRETRELRAPWGDAEWNEARSELFLAALALHKALLVHAARPMRESLDGAMEILSGNAPRDLSAEATLAAWQALFLVVPVVSTTFASVSRLFGPLAAQALGWLLVDEAGQATPQNVVGALWRSQRAVIVGDPLQLEPITTIPFEAEQAIRAHYGVGEEWLTGRGSVQSIADRLNLLGTTLPGAEGQRWVGAPLAVHRRCDRPMFDISNEIAYDGLMVEATDPALAQAFAVSYPTLPQSKWIDVRSETSHGHWIPAEGDEVDRILTHLGKIGFDFSQAMAIAPFRDVARPLRERTRAHPGLRAGTIHTAQGKEADIVILVLGSDPTREGARMWAAERPNLLNVAVSRAKRRLYVIGNREAWMRQRYFNVLADCLPHDQSRL